MEDFDPKMIFVFFHTFWILGKFEHDDFQVGFQFCIMYRSMFLVIDCTCVQEQKGILDLVTCRCEIESYEFLVARKVI